MVKLCRLEGVNPRDTENTERKATKPPEFRRPNLIAKVH